MPVSGVFVMERAVVVVEMVVMVERSVCGSYFYGYVCVCVCVCVCV